MQVVMAHTPFRQLLPQLGDAPVLVVGRQPQAVEELARACGFKRVVTTAQLWHALGPGATPFAQHAQHGAGAAAQHGSGSQGEGLACGTADNPIRAVLVFSDPSDW